jgi:hypothetical protein
LEDIDKEKVASRVTELTHSFDTVPWKLVTSENIDEVIEKQYKEIGDI